MVGYSGSGVDPNPAYRPPWEGGRSSGRDELALPIRSKNASLPLPPCPAVTGVPLREGLNGEEELLLARDLRVA